MGDKAVVEVSFELLEDLLEPYLKGYKIKKVYQGEDKHVCFVVRKGPDQNTVKYSKGDV